MGPWSNWTTFITRESITGSVKPYINYKPTSYDVSATFVVTSGHTVTGYSWELYRLSNGVWNRIGTSTNPQMMFAGLPHESSNIDYRINLLVTGTKNNIQSQGSFAGYITYMPA